jgi:hypothetical protein
VQTDLSSCSRGTRGLVRSFLRAIAAKLASAGQRLRAPSEEAPEHGNAALHPGTGSRNHRANPVLTQYDVWQKMDAIAAEAWLQAMPMDSRTHLSTDPAPR